MVALQQSSLAVRQTICHAMRMMGHHGLFGINSGHISSYDPNQGRFWIVGHVHAHGGVLKEVTPDDIIGMDLDGNVVEGDWEPVSEYPIHTEIYRVRPDIRSACHVHPPLAVAFSVANTEILPLTLTSSMFYPRVPICPISGQVTTRELGQELARTLGPGKAVLQKRHGAVTVGECVEEAAVLAVWLEAAARSQYVASLVGKPDPVRPDEIHAGGYLLGVKRTNYLGAWRYYLREVGIHLPDEPPHT